MNQKEIQMMIWQDFVEQYNKRKVKPAVDIEKVLAMLNTSIAFKRWSLTLNAMNIIFILSLMLTIILIFYTTWWIPLCVTVLSLIAIKAIRDETVNTVIRQAMSNEIFYYHAVNNRILRLLSPEQ